MFLYTFVVYNADGVDDFETGKDSDLWNDGASKEGYIASDIQYMHRMNTELTILLFIFD